MIQDWKPTSSVAKIVYAAGFLYDPQQDIIYSRQDALQRKAGYAYGYDVLAPCSICAKIDCEPFFFTYEDNDWMIELWKGQYGIETGSELGFYIRPHTLTKEEAKIYPTLDKIIGRRPYDPNPKHSRFFRCPTDQELNAYGNMSIVLNKNSENGKQLIFKREAFRDWWLTGFKWGLFSEPGELSVDVQIEFSSAAMRDAFVDEWKQVYADQKDKKIDMTGNSVAFTYNVPATPQPWAQPGWERFVEDVQKLNKKMVTLYNEMGFPSNDPNLMKCDQKDLMHLLDLMTNRELVDHLFENASKTLEYAEDYFYSDVVAYLKNNRCNIKDVEKILKHEFKLDIKKAEELIHSHCF